MRIGIDTRMYSPKFTGIGRYVKELIDHITKLDTENEYILFFNDEEYSQYMAPNARVSKRRVKAKHYSLAEQTSFTKALNTEELDLVHFTHFNAPILYKKPSIVTLHDLTLTKFPDEERSNFVKKFGYQMTIKNIVQKAKRIITVSANTKEDSVKYLGAKIDKIKVIYEGVGSEFKPITDQAVLSNVKQKYGITKPFFLYVGAWRKHKNLVMLVKAFNLFKNSHGLDYQLVIAGGNQDQNSEVLKTIQDFGLRAHVVTPGYIDDVDLPALYSAATAFTFPSLYEGFGLPILESMACGTATLVSNTSSMPEIAGQDNAIFFDPNSMDQIAENMYKIITDETLRNSLGQKGIERAKQFTWEKMAEQTLSLYREVGAEIMKKQAQPTTATPPPPAAPSPTSVTPPAAPEPPKQPEPPKTEIPEE